MQCRHPMTIQVSKESLVFLPSLGLGTRELHLLRRVEPKGREYKGPLVVLLEVHAQLFSGDASPMPLSQTTLTRRLQGGGRLGLHHKELCDDRKILNCLAQQGVTKGRVPHLLLISLPCLVGLMQDLCCPQAMITPLELLKQRSPSIMQASTLHLPFPIAPPSFSMSMDTSPSHHVPPYVPSCERGVPTPSELLQHVQASNNSPFPTKLPPTSIWGDSPHVVSKR